MKAIVQGRYGPPESIRLQDIPVPSVAEGEVLVRVQASSVNAADIEILSGGLFVRMASPLRPANRITGSDVAGVVERVGPGVADLKAGDEVIADLSEHGVGAFAEFVAAPAGAFGPKPPNLTFEQAAAVPSAAWVAIKGIRDKRDLGSKSTVLINGAGGGMGTFAVQMAVARGAEVTGVDSAPKLEMIRSIGADHVVDYQAQDVTLSGGQYDLILDVQARRSPRDWRRVLAADGAYLMVGGSTRRILQGALYGQVVSQSSDMEIGILPGWPHSRRDMEGVNELIEAGSVRPIIDRTYPLAEAAEAMRYVEAGLALGKVVIAISPDQG